MQLDDQATILARADFFKICTGEQRRLLAFSSQRLRHAPGTIIYKSGEVPEGAHVLVSGSVASAYDGEANPYIVSTSGALMGPTSLVLAKPRPVTITAVDQVETLHVPRSAFLKLLNQNPDLAQRAADRLRAELTGYLGAISDIRPRIRRD
ncbi:cyclic nucleotide-binding domain-containing protein [Arsenicitalea aurantiaca]|uniref:Cyclic nucleotide-binding domain-containing protein n=1 Tax=Arsenicitalea aurantiaca TaxID=1783274 RepID=A0A433X7T6_9HYPH|nr:cyclic nucleotide-binding domain-containing protein [Arsenicitalea aurantiaca]RUT30136.1 cyclic nucleotide-binding domain-containing protein [Arsenicitalea aurantiaca]